MKAGNEVCEWHNHPDGRLLRSMEYWVQWNKLVEVDAHFRVQLETVSSLEVCVALETVQDEFTKAFHMTELFSHDRVFLK